MTEETTIVVNQQGVHMRPSMIVIDVASQFQSNITLTKEDQEVNAKSIMEVTMLAAVCGDNIIVKAEGDDEQEAVSAIVAVIESGFEKIYVEE